MRPSARLLARFHAARATVLGLVWLMVCAAGMPVAAVAHALSHLPATASSSTQRGEQNEGHDSSSARCDICAAFDAFEEALLPALPVISGLPPQVAVTPWAPRMAPSAAARWFEPRAPPVYPLPL